MLKPAPGGAWRELAKFPSTQPINESPVLKGFPAGAGREPV